MLEIRFLNDDRRLKLEYAATLKEAREFADKGFEGANQAVIVRLNSNGTSQYIEVREIGSAGRD